MTAVYRVLIGRIEHMTKSRMKEGKIPTRRDVGLKKLAKVLESFQTQADYPRAMELIGSEWDLATREMSLKEIIARFVAMISPEIYAEAPKAKPFHPPHAPAPAPPGAGTSRRKAYYDKLQASKKHGAR